MATSATHAKHEHPVPLWTLFLILLTFTAAEVGIFEIWHRTQVHGPDGAITWQLMPKYVMVLMILIFTLPKALIVMIYFMHLKFEKQFVITLAIIPFALAVFGVLMILSDSIALRDRHTYPSAGLSNFVLHGVPVHTTGHSPESKPAKAAPVENSEF